MEDNSLIIEAGTVPQDISYTPDAPEPTPEPKSGREAIEAAAAKLEKESGTKIGEDDDAPLKKEDVKAEEKKEPEKPAKERDETGKFKAKETQDADLEATGDDEQDGDAEKRSSEVRDYDKPPARFLPRAKEKWATVDEDVRGEVYRAFSEMEKGLEQSREDREFRKSVREYEEMAKSYGTNLQTALQNYTAIDKLLKENPVAGVEKILGTVGITPQQYATHILQREQMVQQNPALAHTQQLEAQIQQLNQQIQVLTQGTVQDREAARIAAVERDVIAPFRADHPRFDELEQDIVFFLNSDKIPSNLPERQRLEAAYDMAERINPAPYYEQPNRTGSDKQSRQPNPAGAKSIKGSPNGAHRPSGKNSLSAKESITAAMDRIGF